MTQLNEQVALVTGATSGIGEAIALHLASLGVRLCAAGRNSEALEKVAQEAQRLRSAVKTYQADLTNDEQVAEIVDNIKKEFGGLDILVHCAGVYAMGPLECASVQDLDDLYRANVRAPLLLTQHALPLIKSRHGQLVFINSTQGLAPSKNVGLYAATQHARRALADGLREELNPDGVRVLSVFVGRTATPMIERICRAEGREYRPELLLQPAHVAITVGNALQMPYHAEITNISIRPRVKSY